MDDRSSRDIELWRNAYRGTQLPGSEGCPDPETLAALLLGEGPETGRVALPDHVVGCRACTEMARDLLALDAEARDELAAPGERGRLSRRSTSLRWTAAAVAATLVMALALVLGPWRWSRPEPAGAGDRGAPAAPATVRPADGASLAAPPARLEWEPLAGASSYGVVLYDAESGRVWEEAGLPGSFAILPIEVREGLAPGTYFWRVTALVGVEPRQSELYRFTVTR